MLVVRIELDVFAPVEREVLRAFAELSRLPGCDRLSSTRFGTPVIRIQALVDVKYEISYGHPRECPGPISDFGSFIAAGRIQSKNGVVMELDDDYDASELLWYYSKERKAGVSGVMVLSIRIGGDGKARKAQVVKSLSPNLDRAAIKAVRKWKSKLKQGDPKFLPDDFEFQITFTPLCSFNRERP